MSIEDSSASDLLFKVIAIGDANVGKTALIQRYATNKFEGDYITTLGMNVVTKNVERNNKNIEYCLWDIAGQPSFKAIVDKYYLGALGAFIVFDLTRKSTFDNVEKWIGEMQEAIKHEIPLIILGNKSDLVDEIKITQEEIDAKINKLKASWSFKVEYFTTSAKDGKNVNEAFLQMTDEILAIIPEEEEEDDYDFLK